MGTKWNNTTQPPNEFIKTFQNWRDEIYNYEQSIARITIEYEDDVAHPTHYGRHQILPTTER
eukprot:2342312-Amphidinium_carterae.2